MEDKNTLLILNMLHENFEKVFTKLDEHDKKFEKVFAKFDEHDKKFEKVFGKLDEHDKKFSEYGTDIKEIKAQLHKLNNTVTKIEYEHDKKIQIGLEKLSMVIDKTDYMQESLDRINSKLDHHDIHIEVLEEKVL